MASGDMPPLPPRSPSQSWAQIASVAARNTDNSPLHNSQALAKLKDTTSEFVRMNCEAITCARMRFRNFLYGKFFGKPPLYDQVKMSLMAKWVDIVRFNSLIRCVSHNVMQRLLLEGPWSINGIMLQLSLRQLFFMPAFAKLNIAAIWVYLYNLPVDF